MKKKKKNYQNVDWFITCNLRASEGEAYVSEQNETNRKRHLAHNNEYYTEERLQRWFVDRKLHPTPDFLVDVLNVCTGCTL